MLERGEPLPVDFRNRAIYCVEPVSPVRGKVVGPAGPTTSTRMAKFTEVMLERTGLVAMVGKAELGPEASAAIRRHGAAYLVAFGGAAYLVSKAVHHARTVAFEELGTGAIYEFDVNDMPVTVAVDARAGSVHRTSPQEVRGRTAALEHARAEWERAVCATQGVGGVL